MVKADVLRIMRKGVMPNSNRFAAVEIDSRFGDPDPGTLVPRRHTVDGFALAPGCVEGVTLQSLETGTVLKVITRHSHYRLVVLDPARQSVLVTGGRLFPESSEVRCEGATTSGSMLKVGWIGVGLRLELSIGRQRITTSRIHSVTIENIPPRLASHLTF